MATDLLKAKGDTGELGINWQGAFFKRWPQIKTKFVSAKDYKRFLAEDYDSFEHWFQLYKREKTANNVADCDVWNLDEKGVMLGVARVIISKHEKNPHTTQSGNREWVTSTECVSLLGRKLGSWTIFKGKVSQVKWHKKMKDLGLDCSGYHICTSVNGWTDNELGLEYLKEHSDPQSAQHQEGEYRILIVDGHDSHLTTDALRFCVEKKIILLCLPPSATHLLQPLDVGVFGPVGEAYKDAIRRKMEFGETWVIDKVDFLEVWHIVRDKAMTKEVIQSAWQKSGLLPYDPNVVLSQIPPKDSSRPSTAAGAPLPENQFQTPATTREVEEILKKVGNDEMDEVTTLLAIQKLGKAASKAIAATTTMNAVNESFAKASKKQSRRKQDREAGDYGKARVMGQKEIEERQAYGKEVAWEAISKVFRSLGPEIFTTEITKKGKTSAKSRPPSAAKQQREFHRLTKPFLAHLTPEVFTVSIPRLVPSTSSIATEVTERGVKQVAKRVTVTRGHTTRERKAVVRKATKDASPQGAKQQLFHLSRSGRISRHTYIGTGEDRRRYLGHILNPKCICYYNNYVDLR